MKMKTGSSEMEEQAKKDLIHLVQVTISADQQQQQQRCITKSTNEKLTVITAQQTWAPANENNQF